MPAIDLTRITKQIQELIEVYSDPIAFVKRFHALLEFYHRYSHRPHPDTISRTFLRSYNLPPQVLPQIELGMGKIAAADPKATFDLVRHLHQDSYYEANELALDLLGKIPITEITQVFNVLLEWLSTPVDRAVLEALFTKANANIITSEITMWEKFLFELLENPQARTRNYALFGLSRYVKFAPHNRLPMIYTQLRPLMISPNDLLDANLKEVVQELLIRSPGETAYYLKEILADTPGYSIENRIRSYLQLFDPTTTQNIQNALRVHHSRTVQEDAD